MISFLTRIIILFAEFNIILFFFGYSISNCFLKNPIKNNPHVSHKVIFYYAIGFAIYFPVEYLITTFFSFTMFTGNTLFQIFSILSIFLLLWKRDSEGLKQKNIKYLFVFGLSIIVTLMICSLIPIIATSSLFATYYPMLFLLYFIFEFFGICLLEGITWQKFKDSVKNLRNNTADIILWTVFLISLYAVSYIYIFPLSFFYGDLFVAYDPFYWEAMLIKLVQLGIIKTEFFGTYPYGFILYSGSIFLPFGPFVYSDIHFFCKIFPHLSLYMSLVILGILLNSIFPKRKTLMFTCIIIYGHYYFIYRLVMFLSTNFITLVVILMIFLQYMEVSPKYTSLVVSSFVLVHHLYALFLIGIVLINLLFKSSKNDDKYSFGKRFKDILITIVIFFSFILILTINLLIKLQINFISAYMNVFLSGQLNIVETIADYLWESYNNYVKYLGDMPYDIINLPEPIFEIVSQMTGDQAIIFYSFLFIIGSFLIPSRKLEKNIRFAIVFSKWLLLGCLVILFLQPIYLILPIRYPILNKLIFSWLYAVFQHRTLEIMMIPYTILLIYVFYNIGECLDRFFYNHFLPFLIPKIKNCIAKSTICQRLKTRLHSEKYQNKCERSIDENGHYKGKKNLPKISFLLTIFWVFIIFNESILGFNIRRQQIVMRETVYDVEIHVMIKKIFEYQNENGLSDQIFFDSRNPDIQAPIKDYFSGFSVLIGYDRTQFNNYEDLAQFIRENGHDGDLLVMSNYDAFFMSAYMNPSEIGSLVYQSNGRILIIQVVKE